MRLPHVTAVYDPHGSPYCLQSEPDSIMQPVVPPLGVMSHLSAVTHVAQASAFTGHGVRPMAMVAARSAHNWTSRRSIVVIV